MPTVYVPPTFQARPGTHLPPLEQCRIEIRLHAFHFRQRAGDFNDSSASRHSLGASPRIPPCQQCASFGDAPSAISVTANAAPVACPPLFWRSIRLRGLRASFRHLDLDRFVLLPSPATSQNVSHSDVEADSIVSPFDVDARVSCLDSHDPSAAQLPMSTCHVLVSFAASPRDRRAGADFSADAEPPDDVFGDEDSGSDVETSEHAQSSTGDSASGSDARAGIDFTIRDHDLVAFSTLLGALKHRRASNTTDHTGVDAVNAFEGTVDSYSEKRLEEASAEDDYETGSCMRISP